MNNEIAYNYITSFIAWYFSKNIMTKAAALRRADPEQQYITDI